MTVISDTCLDSSGMHGRTRKRIRFMLVVMCVVLIPSSTCIGSYFRELEKSITSIGTDWTTAYLIYGLPLAANKCKIRVEGATISVDSKESSDLGMETSGMLQLVDEASEKGWAPS